MEDSNTGSPCKSFKKRKAITCYKLRINLKELKFDHFEFYRITNETPKEYYVLPMSTLQKKSKRHISYHKSGAFHWREDDGSRMAPAEKEADERCASLLKQAIDFLSGQIDGYCIARGKNVSEDGLKKMVDILDGYIIPPLNSLNTAQVLRNKKNHTIPMLHSPLKRKAQRLFKKDAKLGRSKIYTREDIASIIKERYNGLEPTFLEPIPEKYIAPSNETMLKVIDLARSLVEEKMAKRPEGFWTDSV